MNFDISTPLRPLEPATARTAATNKEKALWLLEKIVPGTGINNVGLALQVQGRLRPDALRTAMAIVLGGREVLRTVFRSSGAAELFKYVIPASEFTMEIERLELPTGQLERELTAFVDRPFPLDGKALVRAGFAAHPDGDIFCVAVHHLAFDMASIAAFMRAFVPVYEALAAGRTVPAESSAPNPAFLEPGPRSEDLAYWRDVLRGFTPGSLELWCGAARGRQPVMTGESAGLTLSPQAQRAVPQLQREARAPVAAVLLAAYCALLASHGAGPDIVIGSPVDVRGTNASAIGYHVNVVPLRVRVDFAEGFRGLVRQTRDVFLGAMRHSGTSVDDLAGELPGIGSSWQTALFRHLFNFLPEMSVDGLSIDGMTARLLTIENPYSKFDLELVGAPSRSEILFRYSREILTRADVEAMLRRFDALLVAAARDSDRPIGEVAGWSDLDRQVIDGAQESAPLTGPDPVPTAFGSWVRTSPQAPAVVDGERSLTYGQVHEAATAIRDQLQAAGVRADDVVAVAASRGEALVAALGVWLTGSVYLPLDAGQDTSRLAWQLTHSRAKAVLTGTGVRFPVGAELPAVLSMNVVQAVAREAVGAPTDPLASACLIYSFAPDGRPVTTVLSHAGIANVVGHFAGELPVEPGTGIGTLADITSVASIFDFALALSTGGQVVVAPEEARLGGSALRAVIDHHEVGIVHIPSGVPVRILEDAVDRLPGLRVLAQGEEVSRAVADRLLAAGCRLHCTYGAMDTTGWAVSGWIDDPGGVTWRRPMSGARAFVVAPDGRELPIGVRGELCVAGAGLTQDDPVGPDDPRFSTSERYGRYYRTGQLVRWRSDGTIEWLGRVNRQGDTGAGPEVPEMGPDRSGPTVGDRLVHDLVELWRRLLKTEVTAQTSFFDAGGHSLLAAVLAQHVEELTGISLELSEIFEHPTPGALAARVRA